MFDVITLGSATRDIFINAAFLRKKENYLCVDSGVKYDIEQPFMQTGGGATNTAVAFSRFGLKTSVICKIAKDDPGHFVKETLKDEKIDSSFLTVDDKTGTAFSIVLSKENSDRTIFTYRGASQNITLKDVKLNRLKTRWLYISALRGDSIGVLKPVLEYAKKNGINVAMNPGSKELEMKSIFKHVNVLLLNKDEAEILSGRSDSVNNIIKKLFALGPRTVVITDGGGKTYAYSGGCLYSAKPYNIKIHSTLGAGDAFCSGFVSMLIKNKSMEEVIKFGMLNASSVIQHVGAKTGLLYSKNLKMYENKLRQKLYIHKEEFGL